MMTPDRRESWSSSTTFSKRDSDDMSLHYLVLPSTCNIASLILRSQFVGFRGGSLEDLNTGRQKNLEDTSSASLQRRLLALHEANRVMRCARLCLLYGHEVGLCGMNHPPRFVELVWIIIAYTSVCSYSRFAMLVVLASDEARHCTLGCLTWRHKGRTDQRRQ